MSKSPYCLKYFYISCLAIILLLFSFVACHNPNITQQNNKSDAISKKDSAHVVTLKRNAAQNAIVDSALAINQNIIELAKAKGYEQLLFDTYLKTALTYSNKKDDIQTGKKYIDSAAVLPAAIEEQNKPTLELSKGILYKNTDSSAAFIRNALKRENLLSTENKILAYSTLTYFFITRKNYLYANEYALKGYNTLNRLNYPEKNLDAIVFLNNLYLISSSLKDSAAAFDYLQKALAINNLHFPENGNLNVYQNLGKYYLSISKYDSAEKYFSKFEERIEQGFGKEYKFYPYTYFAEVALAQKDLRLADAFLNKAAWFLHPDSVQDPFIQFDYFETLYQLEKQLGNPIAALSALEKRTIYNEQLNNQDAGQQLAFLQNQLKQTEAEKAIQEKQNKINRQRWYNIMLIISCIAISIIAAIIIMYWRKRKQLESQKLQRLQKEAALEKAALLIETENKERKRIARELHDEMGSTITSIGLTVPHLKKIKNIPERLVDIIERNSKALTQQTREIVWSLNEGNDNLESLVAYIYHHARQFLTDNNFELSYSAPETIAKLSIEGFRRRYIFQAVKEILNNTVKHSNGSEVVITIELKDDKLLIFIKDNGIGLPQKEPSMGNGLKNIDHNIKSVNGTVHIKSDHRGTAYSLNIDMQNSLLLKL